MDGQQAHFHLHGLANTEQEVAVSRYTLFEIGSISKPLTALAALTKIEPGSWQLEHPISALVPQAELPGHHYSLTELITHRSGLPRLPANMPITDPGNPYVGYGRNEIKEALAKLELNGADYQYSNFGYGLLGWLLEQSLQQPFAAIMHESVFQPLGMYHAAIQNPGSQFDHLASGYSLDGTQVSHWQFDSLAGAGAVVATIDDMARMLTHTFATAGQDPRLQQWLTPQAQTAAAAEMTSGWMVDQSGWLWHAGQTAGFCSMLVFSPQEQKGVVILTNIAIPVTQQGFALFEQWLAAPSTANPAP